MAQDNYQMQGDAPALLYERYLVPMIGILWATDLVDRAAPRSGERVLDVACGTGIVARTAASRMQTGHVVGLDINPWMLSVARSVSSGACLPIEWHEGNVLNLPFPAASFDVVLCQLGFQFLPDRPQAMREIFRVLVASGRLALSVFREIERTPMAHAFAEALDRHIKPGASTIKRTEHGFSDANELHRLATDAGFGEAIVVPVTKTIRYAETREYVRVQLTASPQAALLTGMEDQRRNAIIDAIAADINTFLGSTDGGFVSPQEANILLARR
jgi:ubiquinone/menaquinone biosynthesis C-methylase UbiE